MSPARHRLRFARALAAQGASPAARTRPRVPAGDTGDVVAGRVVVDAGKLAWLAGMAGAGVIGGALTIGPGEVAVFVVSTGIVLLLGHSLGMHRLLVHRSFACPRWLERALIACGVQAGLSGPLGLLATHDLRDHAQRQPHCHDYFAHRRPWWQDAAWQLVGRIELERPPRVVLEPALAADRFVHALEATWRWQHLPVAVAFWAVGGWGWVFWGVCLRVVACNVGHWAVGYLAHRRGGMTWRVRDAGVQGYNVPFCALLTMGESWHNHHHAHPGSARLGLGPGEWDPGWWTLRAFAAIGWAWNLRTPADLPPRDGLEAIGPRR